MKFSRLPLLFTFAAILSCDLHAAPSPLSVQVEPVGSRQEEDHGQKTVDGRTLQITIRNASQQDFAAVTVKYFVFAKNEGSKKTGVAKQGEKTVAVAKMASVLVTSDPVTLTSEKQHYDKITNPTGNGRSGSARTKVGKLLPASGERYEGYGVQVFDGGTLLTELFSPTELKDKTK